MAERRIRVDPSTTPVTSEGHGQERGQNNGDGQSGAPTPFQQSDFEQMLP